MVEEKITGLIAVYFTPMKTDGDINIKTMEAYADKLKRGGASGVFIYGTTGEGMLMTNDERKAIAEKWVHSPVFER